MASQSQTVSAQGREDFWDRPLSSLVALDWELVLYGVIFVAAVFTRFYDLGARAVSHDESLHALYSYKLYAGEGYRHDPLMHGPFLFEFTAFIFFLLGDNNFTFRVGLALFGVILVMLPIGFRPWLGRLGTLLASTLLLISPAVLHYSRHVRHDIYVEVFTLLMFIALFRYLRSYQAGDEAGQRRWLLLGAAAVALALSTMETSFIHGFIGLTFIVVLSLFEGVPAGRRLSWFWAGLALLAVVGVVVLWLTFGNAGLPPAEGVLNPARQVIAALAGLSARLSGNPELSQEQHVAAAWKLLQVLVLAAGLLGAAATLALSAARRHCCGRQCAPFRRGSWGWRSCWRRPSSPCCSPPFSPIRMASSRAPGGD
jgi:uncharacterized protein (TIGR03663 family)